MWLHLEFYWIPPHSLQCCDRIIFNATSIDLAVAHAEDILENQAFPPFGKANLCLIKDQDGQLVREVWEPSSRSPPSKETASRRTACTGAKSARLRNARRSDSRQASSPARTDP